MTENRFIAKEKLSFRISYVKMSLKQEGNNNE